MCKSAAYLAAQWWLTLVLLLDEDAVMQKKSCFAGTGALTVWIKEVTWVALVGSV